MVLKLEIFRVLTHLTVFCFLVAALDVRLNGHRDGTEGRVELYYNGSWGSVCDDSWDDNACKVVCRQMKYTGGVKTRGSNYGSCEGPIWLDDVKCRGDEQSVSECLHGFWGQHDCTHDEDAGCICTGSKNSTTLQPPHPTGHNSSCSRERHRIVPYDPSYPGVGRVEVQAASGRWEAVCDDFWDDKDAAVFCSCLGYSSSFGPFRAYSKPSSAALLTEVPVVYGAVHCSGEDVGKNLWDCSHSKGSGSCTTVAESAAVACSHLPQTQPKEAPKVRLECDGGTLHVCFNKTQAPDTKHLYTEPTCRSLEMVQTEEGAACLKIPLDECESTSTEVDHSYKHYCYHLHHSPLRGSSGLLTEAAWNRQVCCSKAKNGTIKTQFTPLIKQAESKYTKTNTTYKLECYEDDRFDEPLRYPAEVTKGQEVFCEIRTSTWDERLFLVVPECRFLAGSQGSPRFTFMENRCPLAPALDLAYFNFDIHRWGFKFKVPKFHGYDQLLLSCDAYVCDTMLEKNAYCDRSCVSGHRKRRSAGSQSSGYDAKLEKIQQGPFIVLDAGQGPNLLQQRDDRTFGETVITEYYLSEDDENLSVETLVKEARQHENPKTVTSTPKAPVHVNSKPRSEVQAQSEVKPHSEVSPQSEVRPQSKVRPPSEVTQSEVRPQPEVKLPAISKPQSNQKVRVLPNFKDLQAADTMPKGNQIRSPDITKQRVKPVTRLSKTAGHTDTPLVERAKGVPVEVSWLLLILLLFLAFSKLWT